MRKDDKTAGPDRGDVGDTARGPVDMKSGWIPSVAIKREGFQELASRLTKGDLTGLSQSRQLAINCGRKLYIHVWEILEAPAGSAGGERGAQRGRN